MALNLCPSLRHQFVPPLHSNRPIRPRKLSVHSRISHPIKPHKLVTDVKEKLEKYHPILPVGKNGRDDEDMIRWFLKDRKFSVEDTVSKLAKAIKWRQEFGVSELSEESVRSVAETGKGFVQDFLDVHGRPVLIVVASKHFPAKQNPIEDEKLCVFLVEKALSRLPAGKEDILGIFDLRGFGTENTDLKFITFVFDVFYSYYPRRLGQVLFVDAPFIFKPIWQLAKPLLKSYSSLDLLNEVERNLQDAMSVARNIIKHPKLLPGGGAAELTVSAIEGIEKHANGENAWIGIDGNTGEISDMKERKVAGHFTYGVMALSAATFLFWNLFGAQILPVALHQGNPVSLALQLSCSVLG